MSDTDTISFGNFGPGSFVNMMYTSPTSPSRTSINFMTGQDIVFHCNPRYDERALVLNSRFNGNWQNEERPYNFPLNYGQPTQVTVAVNEGAIDLFANKREFCYLFRHRYDVTKVNKVSCSGKGTPINVWTGKALPDFTVGKIVYIKGHAPAQKVFTIDMVPSLPHDYRSENIAMHMSVRFNENCVVRNNKSNDQWAGEERGGGMPFAKGQAFTMTIVAQKDGFEVGVNGSHFIFFRYRVPLTKDMSIQFKNLDYIEKVEYC